MRLTVEKKEEILHKMIACSPNKVYRIDVNDEETIEAFKYIVRVGQDIDAGFELTFNNDYSKISKREYPFVTPPKVSMKK